MVEKIVQSAFVIVEETAVDFGDIDLSLTLFPIQRRQIFSHRPGIIVKDSLAATTTRFESTAGKAMQTNPCRDSYC